MDITSLWAFWQKHRSRVGLYVAGVIIFALGWQTGHVMSPYYASSPIVFSQTLSEDHGGTGIALDKVEQANNNLAKKQPTQSPVAGFVAGVNSSVTGPYVASKNSTLYHDVRCNASKRIAPQNRIYFASQQAAVAGGFSPSACTKTYLDQAK